MTWFHFGLPTTISKISWKSQTLISWKSPNLISPAFRHITADPESNPGWYYLKWVVSGTVGGSNGGETKIQSYTSCKSPKFSACIFLPVLESMGIARYHERWLHRWDILPLRDPWPVAVWIRRAMVRVLNNQNQWPNHIPPSENIHFAERKTANEIKHILFLLCQVCWPHPSIRLHQVQGCWGGLDAAFMFMFSWK